MARKMPFKHTLFAAFAVAIALSFAACKPTVPSQYLPFDKVVDILYDYHLADVLAQRNAEDTTAIISYKANILKKHGVKEQDLDSTWLYYMRHTELLHKVYQTLDERFSNEAMAQGATVSELNQFGKLTSNLDTANVWVGNNSLLLFPDAAFNSYCFTIKADTSYHKGDAVLLDFDVRFLYQDGMRSSTVVLAVRHDNDSVTMRTLHASTTNQFHLRIDDTDCIGIKEVKGCFILNVDKTTANVTTLKMASFSNIRLIRLHVDRSKKTEEAQSAEKDSIATPPSVPHERREPLDTTVKKAVNDKELKAVTDGEIKLNKRTPVPVQEAEPMRRVDVPIKKKLP